MYKKRLPQDEEQLGVNYIKLQLIHFHIENVAKHVDERISKLKWFTKAGIE